MGLLGQMVSLVLDPRGIATLSSTMVELIYTPINSVKAFPFLYNLTNMLFFDFLIIATLTGMRWYLIVVFELHFSNEKKTYSFSLLYIHVHCPFFNEIGFFFLIKFLIDSGY